MVESRSDGERNTHLHRGEKNGGGTGDTQKSGGLGGTRTLDQCLKRALLYQLSYQPGPKGWES